MVTISIPSVDLFETVVATKPFTNNNTNKNNDTDVIKFRNI